jgi:hypothetical protein
LGEQEGLLAAGAEGQAVVCAEGAVHLGDELVVCGLRRGAGCAG